MAVRVLTSFALGANNDVAAGDLLTISAAKAAALETAGYVTTAPLITTHGDAVALVQADAKRVGADQVFVEILTGFAVAADADLQPGDVVGATPADAARWTEQGRARPAFRVRCIVDGDGTVSPAITSSGDIGERWVKRGGSAAFVFNVDPGVSIDHDLTLDGVAQSYTPGTGGYTLENVTADHQIRITFNDI